MTYQQFREEFERFGVFSVRQVRALCPDFDVGNYIQWKKKGYLLPLKNGWYAFASCRREPGISERVAAKIYSPSYLSLEYAMARYGLIPESVVQLTSVTTNKTANFKNDFGEFSYRTIKPELMFGYEPRGQVLMATLEKAILDFLYINPFYNTAEELAELRFDEDVLTEDLKLDKFEEYLARFKCKALEKRVKLMRKVYGI